MKLNGIKDFDKFFAAVDKCEGRVELVTSEGDRLNLKSKLAQYVSLAKIFNNGDMKVLSGLEQKSSVEPAKSNSEKIDDKEPVTTHPQQPVTQPQTPQPVNASVDTLDIIDSELMAESMLRDIERFIGIE